MRIDHGGEVTLSNGFKVAEVEDDPNPQEIEKLEGEDFKPMDVKEAGDIGNWVHLSPVILKEGRIKRKEIEEEDDVKKEQMEKERSESDPFERRLKPVRLDKCKMGLTLDDDLEVCWVLRSHGDFSKRHHGYKPTTTDPTIVSLRSLVWPGLVHVVSQVALSKKDNGSQIGVYRKRAKVHFPDLFPLISLPSPDRTRRNRGVLRPFP